MAENKVQRAEAQMRIRKPVDEVFEAIIDPSITTNFWFTKSSGRLDSNREITWTWEMYNVSTVIRVSELERYKKIRYQWDDPATTVEFTFQSLSDGSTFVKVSEYGYQKTGDALIQAIKDSTAGFTTVLDGLKAFLEHGLRLNLIADKFPKEVSDSSH